VIWTRAFLVGEGGFEGLAEQLVDRPVSLLTVLRAVSNFFAASAGTFGHVGAHDAWVRLNNVGYCEVEEAAAMGFATK
jgi:hypothetical protein